MSLQDKLDAVKAEFLTIAPAPVRAIMDKSTDDLIASGQAERALKAGDRAPDFELHDTDGKAVSLRDLVRDGPLVITFYRGTWCPYCNLDLQAMEEVSSDIRERGASLVAISSQTPVNSRKSLRDNKLGFPILSDRGGEVAHLFGLRWELSQPLRDAYGQFGVDLPTFNGEPSWTLPMPARYVIGQDGVIAYAEVNPDYTQRPDPSELLPTLDRLKATAA